MMWSEKQRPKLVQEMVGNEDARLAALKWLSGWVSGSKPLLLVGPPGSGKTTLVHALARQFDYDLVEMNASDTRSKDALQARITPVFQNTANLLGRKIMMFLDEVDGISGREDTGGLDTLVDLMKEPTVPVIIAAIAKST
jgi:replication factor C large subunit